MFAPAIEETRQQSRNLLVLSKQSVGRASELKIDEFDRWSVVNKQAAPACICGTCGCGAVPNTPA